jgi:hypothetical protein
MPAADHSCVRSGSNDKNEYRPRNPEDSLLYRTIAGHLETFLARQQERGREVPPFVEREMRDYLACGIAAHGFLRLRCESCGKDRLLPLSCKGRSVCPSCCGRRMADTAAHLVDRVFPHVPVRQWVLSLPFALRYRLAYDSEMVTAALAVFIRALFGAYRRMARDYGIDQTQCGAVTFVQRFNSALGLNLHFHVIAIDGVYAPGLDGKPEFFPLRPPEDFEVRELAAVLARRIPALLKRGGAGTPQSGAEESDRLERDQLWLSEVYAASVCGRLATGPEAGRRVAVGGDRIDPEGIDSSASPRCASVAGFSLHANVAIAAPDRARLERLCRYAARPPLSVDRLEALPDGRLRYWFKTPWRNGTTHAIFEPLEFIEKLAALVPTPRAHLVRFHGLLGPAAKWRPWIVPNNATTQGPLDSSGLSAATSSGADLADCGEKPKPADAANRHARNYTWSELMKRVFAADVLACIHCGGRLRILATIRAPEITRKILEHLGIPSRPPPVAPAVFQELPFAFE